MPAVVVRGGHCFLPQLENYNLERLRWILTQKKYVKAPTRITQMRKNVLKTRMTSIGTCSKLILHPIQMRIKFVLVTCITKTSTFLSSTKRQRNDFVPFSHFDRTSSVSPPSLPWS